MSLEAIAAGANLLVVGLSKPKGWVVLEKFQETGVFSSDAQSLKDLIIAYESAKNVTVSNLVSFGGRRGFRIFYRNENAKLEPTKKEPLVTYRDKETVDNE